MPTFLHTSDWQLGMTRRFLDADAQARYTQARFDAVRAIGRIAAERGCAGVVVAGDVFESNRVGPAVVARALEAMRGTDVVFYLLPGNHDPFNEGNVWLSRAFRDHAPPNVRVVADANPIDMGDGLELVGAPWPAKNVASNPVLPLLDLPPPEPGRRRIVLAHGAVDAFSPFDDGAAIPVEWMERAVRGGAAHYIALGDRHSLTRVGESGRIWYSGTQEATDWGETDPGKACLVTLDGDTVSVEALPVGNWRFVGPDAHELRDGTDVDRLLASLDAMDAKDRMAVRLDLAGAVPLVDGERLRNGLDRLAALFAVLDARDEGLSTLPGDGAFGLEHLSGFAAETARELGDILAGGGEAARTAADALVLLRRLAPAPEEGDSAT